MSALRDRLHALVDEIADLLEQSAAPPSPPSPRRPRRRPVAKVPAPLGKPSDLDRAAARETLRRRGIY